MNAFLNIKRSFAGYFAAILISRLRSPEKFPEVYSHRLGDSHGCIHGNIFLSAFDAANVHGREVRLFGQAFLRQTRLRAESADVVPKFSPVWRNRMHLLPPKQQRGASAI